MFFLEKKYIFHAQQPNLYRSQTVGRKELRRARLQHAIWRSACCSVPRCGALKHVSCVLALDARRLCAKMGGEGIVSSLGDLLLTFLQCNS